MIVRYVAKNPIVKEGTRLPQNICLPYCWAEILNLKSQVDIQQTSIC